MLIHMQHASNARTSSGLSTKVGISLGHTPSKLVSTFKYLKIKENALPRTDGTTGDFFHEPSTSQEFHWKSVEKEITTSLESSIVQPLDVFRFIRNESFKFSHRKLLQTLRFSFKKEDVNVEELQALMLVNNQNCEQFPRLDENGRVNPVKLEKLKTAIKHSILTVSAFVRDIEEEDDYLDRGKQVEEESSSGTASSDSRRDSFGRKRLVGFVRAYSDASLTAAVHDLVVAPSLNNLGIDKLLLQKLVRELSRKHILDLSVLVPTEKRNFYKECGFRRDMLNSTTMIYLRTTNQDNSTDEESVAIGRNFFRVPESVEINFNLKKPWPK